MNSYFKVTITPPLILPSFLPSSPPWQCCSSAWPPPCIGPQRRTETLLILFWWTWLIDLLQRTLALFIRQHTTLSTPPEHALARPRGSHVHKFTPSKWRKLTVTLGKVWSVWSSVQVSSEEEEEWCRRVKASLRPSSLWTRREESAPRPRRLSTPTSTLCCSEAARRSGSGLSAPDAAATTETLRAPSWSSGWAPPAARCTTSSRTSALWSGRRGGDASLPTPGRGGGCWGSTSPSTGSGASSPTWRATRSSPNLRRSKWRRFTSPPSASCSRRAPAEPRHPPAHRGPRRPLRPHRGPHRGQSGTFTPGRAAEARRAQRSRGVLLRTCGRERAGPSDF